MRVFSEAVVVNKSLLDSGGFGSVYTATLPSLSSDVVVLKVAQVRTMRGYLDVHARMQPSLT